ncbi:MAG: protein phosphatase 2C domain-containing protein [Gammaproteobacteria bacterium]|jgi:serine/threonine protein phosphatase PrpC|nr:serine/threonine protein phosphatase [Chromatiales bacterium]MDP6673761.1 protein phosphatase 2C domain-containing protein [Gammaproteobacteria bacterium]
MLHRGILAKARLFIGDADIERETYTSGLGEVAVVSIGDHEKAGPNEDSAALIPVNNQYLVLIVADGVGGMAGARRASNLTVETIRKHIENIDDTNGPRLRTAILDGIEAANQAVLKLGTGSASTLALAELGPGYVRTYHVGDSILLVCGQRGVLKLLTTPHSPVGFAMEAGLINESEALHHAELNLIFNVIGSADMRIEIGSELPMAARDSLLLASDGLTDNIMQDKIIDTIRSGPVDKALCSITDLALSRMNEEKPGQPSKPDDCTAILFRPKYSRKKKSTKPTE